MPFFQKKRIVIEARQFTGEFNSELIAWAGLPETAFVRLDGETKGKLMIPTLEGHLYASANDWIIKGIKGEFYPCKPDIFEASYETVQ